MTSLTTKSLHPEKTYCLEGTVGWPRFETQQRLNRMFSWKRGREKRNTCWIWQKIFALWGPAKEICISSSKMQFPKISSARILNAIISPAFIVRFCVLAMDRLEWFNGPGRTVIWIWGIDLKLSAVVFEIGKLSGIMYELSWSESSNRIWLFDLSPELSL